MQTNSAKDLPPVAKAFNGKDRNAFLFGWNLQAELWNGRLAMIGFLVNSISLAQGIAAKI